MTTTLRPSVPLREFAARQLSRAAGAPLIDGNRVRILRDAAGHFPVWLEAIASATRTIWLESYIITDDTVGRRFAEALAERARAGVSVRLLYDWIGCHNESGGRYFRFLREAGVEVRCFNPPRIDSPFGWFTRDHRKMLAVDGRMGFVTGLCLSGRWEGDPAKGVPPGVIPACRSRDRRLRNSSPPLRKSGRPPATRSRRASSRRPRSFRPWAPCHSA